ncbi:MAG: undecaprenyldiphospho-muramoylpentapeptide beta-N-acetylglucosaminyltransferase [Proteobacteria bacterium]|nr:undecaprenyldiphospho-muramoylpentapeptide beta-N-acetylglucosaminyltransferase [Pseudomonadota bacterium]
MSKNPDHTQEHRVLVSTGGTAGHVFPAIVFVEELSRHGIKPLLVCDQRGERWLNKLGKPLQTVLITTARSSKRIPEMLKFPLLLAQAFFQCYRIIRKSKPKLVVGFGGYASFPLLLCCRFVGIPFILHEQNSVLGKVNKMFATKALKLAISFPDTIGIDNKAGNSAFIGTPVRLESSNSIKMTQSTAFKILVIGGSQAAAVFSQLIPAALAQLPAKYHKLMHISMQTPANLIEQTKSSFEKLGINYDVRDFFDNISQMMQSYDLVIARSGASTIAELTAYGMPSILVPYPSAADNHQYYNAKYLADNGAAVLITEKDWATQATSAIKNMLDNADACRQMRVNAKKLAKPNAAAELTQLVLSITDK